MSINLTQQFIFETDDIVSFETMLNTIVRILSQFKNKSYYPTVLFEEPSCWENGQWENYTWQGLPMMLPRESEVLLVESCATYGGASQLKQVDTAATLDEAASKICARKKEPKPRRQWISTVTPCPPANWRRKVPQEKCHNYKSLLDIVMTRCKTADHQSFLQNFSHAEISNFDGSIEVGSDA